MKENLIHYRTCVCNINYHVVWSVKYRRKVLTPDIEAFLKELVQQIALDKGFNVHLFECVLPDESSLNSFPNCETGCGRVNCGTTLIMLRL